MEIVLCGALPYNFNQVLIFLWSPVDVGFVHAIEPVWTVQPPMDGPRYRGPLFWIAFRSPAGACNGKQSQRGGSLLPGTGHIWPRRGPPWCFFLAGERATWLALVGALFFIVRKPFLDHGPKFYMTPGRCGFRPRVRRCVDDTLRGCSMSAGGRISGSLFQSPARAFDGVKTLSKG